MKSSRECTVALAVAMACALAAAPVHADAGPDRVLVAHSCIVDGAGRARALSPEALVPRPRAALADTNHLRVAYDSPDDPWTATELTHLQSYVAGLLPLLEEVCGPPSGSDLIDVIKDRSLADQGFDGTYTPAEHAIRLVRADPATLCHELAHAFHGDDVVYWDAFEEGMAVATSTEVLERLSGYPPPLDTNGAAYELLNQPSISPHQGFFWSGLPAVGVRYGLAGYVWRKAAIEHPGFLREFNRRYYEQLAASDTLRRSIGGLITIAAEVAPEMEGMPFRAWADRQYVLGTTKQLGVQIYQFGFAPAVALFFRHVDGSEDPLVGQELTWKVTDGDELSAGAGTLLTDFGGIVFLHPDVPALSLGSLRIETGASTPYGSQTSVMTRPLTGGKGFFGVVRGASEGSVTVTPLDTALASETVPVQWGEFQAPRWQSLAGRFELVYTDPSGRRVTRRVTKDAASYLALIDAPPGAPAATSASLTARPSIALAGCRFTTNRPLADPARVTIYSVSGKILRVLTILPGTLAVDWDGQGADGLFASAGVYVARLVAPGVEARTRVVVTH
jgi:hypothetical protein